MSRPVRPRALFAGSGIAVPPLAVDNHMLARIMETNDQWIQERSGIVTRHYVDEGVGSTDLAVEAAAAALEDAGVAPGEVDHVVFACMTPDRYFPGGGPELQKRLGLPMVPVLEIRQQCAGFAYGLQTVDALIGSGLARTVLVVGADVHTALMPYSKRTWRVLLGEEEGPLSEEEFEWNSSFRHLLVLFGDGAGAMVFRASEEEGEKDISEARGILGSRLYADGENQDILLVPGLGSKHRPFVTAEMIADAQTVPVMDGRAVFKLAVQRMPDATLEVLKDCGYGPDDLDLVIMHQANLRINEACRKALDLPEDKVHNNIQRYGNTTSATLPLAFHEARQASKAAEGDLVAFTALGAGLHWGSVLMRM